MARYIKSGSVTRVPEINSELEKIATAQTEFLSRNGETPNEMLNTLDMNNNRITNLPTPASATDAARLVDVTGEHDITVGIDETPVFDNIAEMTSTNLAIGQSVRCKRYYSGGDLVAGLVFEIVASGTGTDDGGSFHNLSNGNQAELIKPQEVSYVTFGARLDGVNDDSSAIISAHTYCGISKVKLSQKGGTAKISGATTIPLLSDCEWSEGFKFLIETLPTAPFLFEVQPEYTPIELTQADVTLSEFSKNASTIPSLSGYSSYYAVVRSNDLDLRRTNDQLYEKRSVTKIGTGGSLTYPLTTNFSSIREIVLSPTSIGVRTISGFAIEVSTNVSLCTPLRVSRNNTDIINPVYIEGNYNQDVPARQFVSILACYGVNVKNVRSDRLAVSLTDVTYTVNKEDCAKINIDGIESSNGWAQIDANYCRDVTIENMRVRRVGGHFSCWDYSFKNIVSTGAQAISIAGGGDLYASNITLRPSTFTDVIPIALVYIREDFASEWDGNIYIDGGLLDFSGTVGGGSAFVLSSLIDSVGVTKNFGRDVSLPKSVTVKNISILLNESNSTPVNIEGYRFGAGGSSLAGGHSITYPESINIDNINIGKNVYNVGGVFVQNRIRTLVTFGSVPAPSGSVLNVSISNVNRHDPRLSNTDTFDTTGDLSLIVTAIPDLVFNVKVRSCDWFRASFSGEGVCRISDSSIASISGTGRYELFDNKYQAAAFSGTWKALVSGGVVANYIGLDANPKTTGFPNVIEDNFAACKNLFVENGGGVRTTTQSNSTIQTGFYDASLYTAP